MTILQHMGLEKAFRTIAMGGNFKFTSGPEFFYGLLKVEGADKLVPNNDPAHEADQYTVTNDVIIWAGEEGVEVSSEQGGEDIIKSVDIVGSGLKLQFHDLELEYMQEKVMNDIEEIFNNHCDVKDVLYDNIDAIVAATIKDKYIKATEEDDMPVYLFDDERYNGINVIIEYILNITMIIEDFFNIIHDFFLHIL
jgi:hypothetical protein